MKGFLASVGARVVGEADSLASGLSLVTGLHPDILIVDLPSPPDQTLETIKGLRAESPEIGLIVTSQDASPQLILRCMRTGAGEFLTRPVDNRELGEAVRRLAGQARRTVGVRKKTGKIVTVFSAKGGVGVTSVATNLGVSMAKSHKKNAVVVDLNFQMGDVGLMLDLHPEYTLADAFGTAALDESRLKGLLSNHESGLHLLSTPEDPIETEKITPGGLLEVFGLLRGMFDVVVVDAGHVFDGRVLEVLNLADVILVVSVLDVPTVRNVRRCLNLFHQLGYSPEKVRLVVNRHERKTKVRTQDLEETAQTKVFWEIPNDYKTVIAAIDAGVPAVIQAPRSKLSQSIEELAGQLLKISVETSGRSASGDEEIDLPKSVGK
jgi:pilus assembly protein CpaE